MNLHPTEVEVRDAIRRFTAKNGIIKVQEPELDPSLNLMVGEQHSQYEILSPRWMYIIGVKSNL